MKSDEFSRNRSARIGIFGGTFNPIHKGHVRAARDVLQSFSLDRIYFIPSASPPHKNAMGLADAEDRVEMVRLALQDQPRLMVCDVEIERTGPSYSIDTVRQLKAMASEQAHFYFMVGVDAFLEIHTWNRFEALFEETEFIVMSRPGSGLWSQSMRRQVEAYVQMHVSEAYELSEDGNQLGHPHRSLIHLVSVTPVDIASSRLRRMIHRGEKFSEWMAPGVADYIRERGLYQ